MGKISFESERVVSKIPFLFAFWAGNALNTDLCDVKTLIKMNVCKTNIYLATENKRTSIKQRSAIVQNFATNNRLV